MEGRWTGQWSAEKKGTSAGGQEDVTWRDRIAGVCDIRLGGYKS